MTTVAEENRKTLRQPMEVRCGFAEATEKTANVAPFGHLTDYAGLVNADDEHKVGVFMDLAGDGFLNDGEAIPMETDSTTYRYGYISAGVAGPDGSFTGGFGVTVTSDTHWKEATLWVVGQYGESRFIHYDNLAWSGDVLTLRITDWTPGTRASIVGVYLGKSWLWDNSNLISVSLDLRGINTEIGGELEVSSIEIRAYETTDYTDVIGNIAVGSPIWYTAGYDGDMSPTRTFYLSEPISWQDNVLTVKGQDATMFLENKETPGHYEYSYIQPKTLALGRVKEALEGIEYREIWDNDEFSNYITPPPPVYIPAAAPRSIISTYCNIFRGKYFHVMFVDAGIPTLFWGPIENNKTIYADEISDLEAMAEQNINCVGANIFTNYLVRNAEIETVDATAGMTYFIDLDPPCSTDSNGVQISPEPTSWSRLSPTRLRFKADATTTYTISGWQVPQNFESSDNPYQVSNSESGADFTFDMDMPAFMSETDDDGTISLTRNALKDALERSNILYEFTYRGDPDLQPRDVLNVEVATWQDVQVAVDGLYPATDLYPALDLYPYGVYKPDRRPIKQWEIMTVDTLTLEHSEGGLVSRVKARKGRL